MAFMGKYCKYISAESYRYHHRYIGRFMSPYPCIDQAFELLYFFVEVLVFRDFFVLFG